MIFSKFKRAVDTLSSETVHSMLCLLTLQELSGLRKVSKVFHSLVEQVLHERLRDALLPFGISDTPAFLQLLLKTNGAVVGDVPTWFYDAMPGWRPTNLTIIVPRTKSLKWVAYFRTLRCVSPYYNQTLMINM